MTPVLSGGGLLGHARELVRDPVGLLRRFDAECGDLGLLRFPGERLLVLNTPELAGALLVDEAARFRKSPLLRAALYPLVGDGLFTSDGELWRRQRKLMAPVFQPARIAGFARVIEAAAGRCMATWSDGGRIDLAREATRITMSVAGEALFGAETFDESDELGAALTVLLAWIAETSSSLALGVQVAIAGAIATKLPRVAAALERPVWIPGPCREALAVLDRRVERMIADRRAEPGAHDDLLGRLLREADDSGGMTDRQLRDEIVTLFVAGHETTAATLAWALALLARHPKVYARVEAEARARPDPPIDRRGLPDLPLALQVISEALRMFPPVPVFERQALESVTIGGHLLARGDYAAVFPYALHHRSTVWPDPDRFDPARFANDAVAARRRHAFMPFGAGPRICIGSHFAMLEGALVLAAILRRAHLELVEPAAPLAVDPRSATTRPRGGVPMRVSLGA